MAKFNRFLLGGMIGAGLALLFSPKSGDEIRRMLAGRSPKALPAYDAADYVEFPSEEAGQAEELETEKMARSEAEGAGERKMTHDDEKETAADMVSDEVEAAWEALSKPAEGEPTLEKPPVTPAKAQEAEPPAPSRIGNEEIRRRLEETRARLKARAFEARENETEAGRAGQREKAEPEE